MSRKNIIFDNKRINKCNFNKSEKLSKINNIKGIYPSSFDIW